MKKLLIIIFILIPWQLILSQYKPNHEVREKVKENTYSSVSFLRQDPNIISQALGFEPLLSIKVSKTDDDIENQNLWIDICKWTATLVGSITAAILGTNTGESSNLKNTLGILGAGISAIAGLGIILKTPSEKQNRIKENGGKVLDNWIKLKSLPDSSQTKINVAAELVSFSLRNGITKAQSDSLK